MQAPLQRLLVGCALTILGPLAIGAQSRIGQPIHPGYQGFVANDDGSVTMVFQYFSHGRDSVTVPVGPDNRFNGTEDRNQPVTFLPGNHEFVCVIIVENSEAALQLRWSITFPENESATSIDPLNSEYRLTKRSETRANRDLDVAGAERGVCLNKPPRVLIDTGRRRRIAAPDGSDEADTVPSMDTKLGADFTLKANVTDEGLPRGSSVAIRWRQVDGPGTVTLASPDQAETAASFSAAGVYELELHATDGKLEASARIKINVTTD